MLYETILGLKAAWLLLLALVLIKVCLFAIDVVYRDTNQSFTSSLNESCPEFCVVSQNSLVVSREARFYSTIYLCSTYSVECRYTKKHPRGAKFPSSNQLSVRNKATIDIFACKAVHCQDGGKM